MEVWKDKSPEMREFLQAITPFDPTTGACATCGTEVEESSFRDDLSRKEYEISGMCQEGQDGVFGGTEQEGCIRFISEDEWRGE